MGGRKVIKRGCWDRPQKINQILNGYKAAGIFLMAKAYPKWKT